MIAAILSALVDIWAGVAATSALPPRSFKDTYMPLIIALIVAAILGGV